MMDLWGVAVHEAGHAIVALHYGLPVVRVWINDNCDGGCEYSNNDEHLSLHARFVACLAGEAAERHFNVQPHPTAKLHDYGSIITLTSDMTEDERRPFIDQARAYAAKIIARNAHEVARLAGMVADKMSVTLSEVKPPIVATR